MDRTPRFSLLRFLAALLVAFSLSGLAEAAEEFVENVVHVADTGHGAHASEHPEGDACPDAEHFCFGNLHNCNCCPTALAAPTRGASLPAPALHQLGRELSRIDVMSNGARDRIERPPRG